ncbi:phage protease [Rhodoplanes sp. TEM]|uniref:Phage protease n=1 Tax=Rhodoplanes tepidamans TaxID=200616 RepID=A0ABT5JE66_RHOTP|nr:MULTISPECIES: phage protease [Rhodoplanes]MDC7787975.1 phage protease [Rhodoplanes tepidamans]MDC7984815.1 phage protease [Rhodoplanes sp. TEM]MDQ0358404.1 phage I-like protein [Rhodoplanes tepidamans]
MPDLVIHLFSALAAAGAAGAGGVPEWVHLVPAGTFSGVDGRGPYRLADAQAVIAASMAAGKLAIDENHAIDKAAPDGRPSPARGWIVEMQARPDGLWGRVEWTATGAQLLADHAYRGISPAFVAEKDGGRVVRVLRASLTNDPNLQLATLHDRSSSMDLDALRKALGLAADADEAAILAAATKAHTAVTTHAAEVSGLLARIAAAAGLAADAAATATPDGLVVHLQAVTSAGTKTEAELRGTVIALQTRLTKLEGDQARAEAERAIDKAIADGKPIKPMRDHYIARHTKDPAGVTKELEALPSIHDGGTGGRREPGAAGADGLTAEQRQVCALMGVDPAKYAETLKAEKETV